MASTSEGNQRRLLFQKKLSSSEISEGRLFIPKRVGEKYFKDKSGQVFSFRDSGGKVWRFEYIFYERYGGLLYRHAFSTGFGAFLDTNGLRVNDIIRIEIQREPIEEYHISLVGPAEIGNVERSGEDQQTLLDNV